MIHGLSRRFVLLSTVLTLLLMTVMVGAMNLSNWVSVTRDADLVTDLLARPDLPLHNDDHKGDGDPAPKPDHGMDSFLPHGMSPEVPYESRFFTVRLAKDGSVLETNTDKIISVGADAAADYAARAFASKSERGFVGIYRYQKAEESDGVRIVFLDCGRRLDAFYRFMTASIAVGLAGCAVVFVIFLLAARRIVRPILENEKKQRRFVTDAGHEMKTPLTVISANVDLLESEIGTHESLSDIREMSDRLCALTNDLVSLSRMEEGEAALLKTDFPISELVTEEAAALRAPATAGQKTFALSVEPDLTFHGSPDAIRRLVSLLLDNAVKYAPCGSEISLSLAARHRDLVLTVKNPSVSPLSREDLTHLFDRFYRADSSRNSETGGHGIGLSLAKAITESHGGKISSDCSGGIFTVTVVLPL